MGVGLLHPNALPGPFAKSHEALLQPFSLRRVGPPLKDEVERVWEYLFVVMHQNRRHSDWNLPTKNLLMSFQECHWPGLACIERHKGLSEL